MASSTIDDDDAAVRADAEKKRAQIGLQMANMISAPGSRPAEQELNRQDAISGRTTTDERDHNHHIYTVAYLMGSSGGDPVWVLQWGLDPQLSGSEGSKSARIPQFSVPCPCCYIHGL